MTRELKQEIIGWTILAFFGASFFVAGFSAGRLFGRRAAIRELHDVATCPTCSGTGVVVQEEQAANLEDAAEEKSLEERRKEFKWCQQHLRPAQYHYPEFGHNWYDHLETENDRQMWTNFFVRFPKMLEELCATNGTGVVVTQEQED